MRNGVPLIFCNSTFKSRPSAKFVTRLSGKNSVDFCSCIFTNNDKVFSDGWFSRLGKNPCLSRKASNNFVLLDFIPVSLVFVIVSVAVSASLQAFHSCMVALRALSFSFAGIPSMPAGVRMCSITSFCSSREVATKLGVTRPKQR